VGVGEEGGEWGCTNLAGGTREEGEWGWGKRRGEWGCTSLAGGRREEGEWGWGKRGERGVVPVWREDEGGG